jgi:UDP-glucose 4-epimerase
MYQHLNDMPMSIFGDGEQTRSFSFIDDSLEPLFNAAVRPEASNEIINLGGIEEISINDANKLLCKIIGDDIDVQYFEARHEVKHSIPTYQKSIDILGFEYKTTMYNGLQQMWEWAKKQPMRDRFVWPSYELDKGIYSYWKDETKTINK